jgi:hypothetical protein
MDREQKPIESTEELLRERIVRLNAEIAKQDERIKGFDATIARQDERIKGFEATIAKLKPDAPASSEKKAERSPDENDVGLRACIKKFDEIIALKPWTPVDKALLTCIQEARETSIALAADCFLIRMIAKYGKPREELMPFLRECARAEVLGKPYIFAGLDLSGIYLSPTELIKIGDVSRLVWLQSTCRDFPVDNCSHMKAARWIIMAGCSTTIHINSRVKQIIYSQSIGPSACSWKLLQRVETNPTTPKFKNALPTGICVDGAEGSLWLEVEGGEIITSYTPLFEWETSRIASELAEDAKSLEGHIDELRKLLEGARVKA